MTVEIDITAADRRLALEEELEERLARDSIADPLASVALLCVTCRGLCTSDAHFCKHCGARFNTLVIAAPKLPGDDT